MADLANKTTIQDILRQHNVRPNKLLGQHFLILPEVASIMTEAARVAANDTVLEIGPGLGALTYALASRAGRVIAVEKDILLARILRNLLKENGVSNVEVIEGDILNLLRYNAITQSKKEALQRYGVTALPQTNKVVADIPYYLTARLLRLLLEGSKPYAISHKQQVRPIAYGLQPEMIVLMVQKEVAERVCASPPRMSLLSVSVQYFADADIVQTVPKSAFWPEPEVDSAILRIAPKKSAHETPDESRRFFTVIKTGFRHPRKYLAGNLKKELGWNTSEIEQRLLRCGVPLNARPQDVGPQEWLCLAELSTAFK